MTGRIQFHLVGSTAGPEEPRRASRSASRRTRIAAWERTLRDEAIEPDNMPTVSFDVFLQGFANGAASPGCPGAAIEVLSPFLASKPHERLALLRTGDGEADVYGLGGEALMVNHASGREIWDVLVAVAKAANWAIMPVGCPVCVTTADAINDLPEELRVGVVVVTTGRELLNAIQHG